MRVEAVDVCTKSSGTIIFIHFFILTRRNSGDLKTLVLAPHIHVLHIRKHLIFDFTD